MNDYISFSAKPNRLEGMPASLSSLFDSFQNLAGDPANFGRRRAVVRSAQKVAAQFNQASSQLNVLENDLKGSIQKDVVQANQALADLAGLQRGLDALASRLIATVNSIYSSGRDLNGGTGRDFFTGAGASDIGVNNIVADDLSQLQAGGAARAQGNNLVARDLAKLGSQNVWGPVDQTFVESHAQTLSKLGNTLRAATMI